MDSWGRILETLASYESLGTRRLDNGTRLIGHVPHVAPEAWFHQIFAPLDALGIEHLGQELGHEIPAVLADFFLKANGIRIFSGHLYLCGRRSNYSRQGEAAWQPFSILTPNQFERPRNARPTHLFIGGYGPDGSLLYLDGGDLSVSRCSARSAKPLHHWTGFEAMLESEVQRLSTFFDRDGKLKNPGTRTTP